MTTRQTVTLAALVMAGISLSSIVSYCAGRAQGKAAAQLEQDERKVTDARTVRTTAVQAATRAVERVSEAKPMVRVAHDAAAIVDATTADSLVIQRQAVVIADLHAIKTPRCQAKCGALIMGATIVGGGLVAKHAGDITAFLKGIFR